MSDSSKNTCSSDAFEISKSTKTIQAVSQILSEIIEENRVTEFTTPEFIEKHKNFAFTAKKPPSISIHAYVERILKYTHMEESSLVMALIFIDRACELNDLILNDCNVHR